MQNAFAIHTLNEEGRNKSSVIALGFSQLLTQLEGLCMDGREFSIAKSKLEEACFYAKKAMAMNPVNQEINDDATDSDDVNDETTQTKSA